MQIKETSKFRVTGLCVGNSPGTGEFPAQMASNAGNVSIWWRHHLSPARHLAIALYHANWPDNWTYIRSWTHIVGSEWPCCLGPGGPDKFRLQHSCYPGRISVYKFISVRFIRILYNFCGRNKSWYDIYVLLRYVHNKRNWKYHKDLLLKDTVSRVKYISKSIFEILHRCNE